MGKNIKKKFEITDIDDYQNRLDDNQKKTLLRHCNKHNIKPNICAWYDNWTDFCSDWVDDLGYTKIQARNLLNNKHELGEFKIFKDKSIVRLVK